jgi:hypothetical protein
MWQLCLGLPDRCGQCGGFTDDQIYAQVASVFEILKKENLLELSE